MSPTSIEMTATLLFAIAVAHTFSIKTFQHLALKFPEGSVAENLFHLLGEVEIVFGLWAGVFVAFIAIVSGSEAAVQYVESVDFTEPLFVFAIMAISATKPVLDVANFLISSVAKILSRDLSFYVSSLTIGPLLGSFITEPAAMTVTALVMRDRFFRKGASSRFLYATLGVLFVNVSVGGVLTPYAAPPVLMVAKTWHWNLGFMASHFGWKAALAVAVNALVAAFFFSKELKVLERSARDSTQKPGSPWWLQAVHLAFLGLVVVSAHHPAIFLGAFLFFLGVCSITKEYQEELKLKESLLVAFFLAGLVLLGRPQQWWLSPLLHDLDALSLFLGATALTAVTDNAALTFLGSQVPGTSAAFKYALVSGAVAGGGLTVIANAPNPAGFAILQDRFGKEGISPKSLFIAALAPTLIAMACFWSFS